ncbi:MAG: YeeE/YedE family protein [Eubacteriales bacterium]
MAENKINKAQSIIALIILACMAIFSFYINNNTLTLFLFTGIVLGYILTRSRFGFAGGVKRIYITGEGSLNRALFIMFAISIILVAGIQWAAASKGVAIPGTSSVKMLNISTILGGFLFGIGMILAGGCASGTLSDLGEGAMRALIALIFFIFGSIPGAVMQGVINNTAIGKIGATVYLPDILGYIGAVIVSLLLLFILYVIVKKYEEFRKKEGFYEETVYEPIELPITSTKNYNSSYKIYHKLFIQRWSFLTGGILLAIMFVFIIQSTGHSWGVTSAFTNWGVAFLQMFGVEFTSPALASAVKAANNGLINDAGSLRNVGIIIGAAVAFLLAGRFKFDFDFRLKDIVYYAIGGALMGFGARVAGGCNIGALFSGIGNFSLSGWGFLVALVLGAIAALKLFAGKVNIIPEDRHKQKVA